MSLIRQIWCLVLGAVLASVLGGVAVSTWSLRELLQTQAQLKNNDNANALALALSQQKGDAELMSLLISAQFDAGAYDSVRWRNAQGKAVFERHLETPQVAQAPGWFVALLPLRVAPGLAKVSDGWRAVGEVEVRGQTAYVHEALWKASLSSALWLLLVGALTGVAAFVVLTRLRRPLDTAVRQAEGVTEGRFETVLEPQVPEMRKLTSAMNTMVVRTRQMFEAQAEQLRTLHHQLLCDELTGLSHRRQFVAELSSALERDDGPLRAGLVLLRLKDLQGLNQRLGHGGTDQALLAMAQALRVYPEQVRGCLAGRLNGSDFALWLPAPKVVGDTAHALADALRAGLQGVDPGIGVALGAVELPRDQPMSAWFAAADAALARAEQGEGVVLELRQAPPSDEVAQGERAWRALISDALAQQRSRLLEFPLIGRERQVLHLECPLQLKLNPLGEFEPAARWLPLALRHRLSAEADLQALALALAAVQHDQRARCVNVAPASLNDGSFVARARELVQAAPAAVRRLIGLELAEPAAVQHFEALQELGRQLRPLGVQLGLEHAGAGLAQIDRLFQAGLDYVKLDSSVVSGISADAGRAAFVRSLVVMLRSLALKVYAEGVTDALDAQALWDCELDGITGPWASAQDIKP
ncbi:EAL domain, c-di-GMP-specific phosphodiesterase class I (or its enzymatically inactive variant) [Roseateles sp. YR242]|uniref:bifunctional diguanylate cyclase/phosphodiesterase n=1 Tax=Roseateles sp. YR242 TaxID=1855305 RepID=UPI0008B0678A|nr:LapD/MoxY N-terminal periplasmic domain-containing protein [Roseateles sp. YR242]SEK99074.1 EAL domain, c-di-GMP-specific phosphodiesterase class I (or its enzymatically inactive variant) [Roseateles sp. YR242]